MTASTDPSTRFVLPADAPYLANLAALWCVNASLARQIESLPEESPAGFVIEPSKSGAPTLVARLANGRTVSLHSKYNPVAEAAKLLDTVNTAPVAFYVLGLGLGYHLEALFERVSPEANVFLFEPDVDLLRTAFETRDLSAVLSSGRLHIFTTADKGEIFTKLTPQSAMCSMGFEGVSHPPSLALHPEFFATVQTILTEFAAYSRTSLNTLLINGRRTAENIAHNIAAYADTTSIDALKDRYQGRPAIIVSAGPSLRKNKHLLKDASGRAVIIAVQTILQPLIEMGIEPEFATSLDYHDISTRYYEKLPKDLKTHLVAEPKASPKIFDLFPGPVTVLGSDYADRLVREVSPEFGKGRLRSGATVAHLAYYLAEHLGCDPIIFVGQDLGFSDGLAYAPGTNIDDVWRPELSRFCTVEMKQWEFIARDRHILRRVPDHEGKPMYTEERLFTYLQQFERDFLRTKTRIIDATEGGAAKRGAAVMQLADAIREFCNDPVPQATPDGRPGQHWLRAGKCVASLQSRREEARQIEMISQDTLPLLEEVRDHLDDQPRVNQAIAKIDSLRARMDQFGATYDLVTQLTQQTELQRFQRDRQINADKKLAGVELQRRQIDRDIENVRAVEVAAKDFQKLMDDVVHKLLHFTDPATREAA